MRNQTINQYDRTDMDDYKEFISKKIEEEYTKENWEKYLTKYPKTVTQIYNDLPLKYSI